MAVRLNGYLLYVHKVMDIILKSSKRDSADTLRNHFDPF